MDDFSDLEISRFRREFAIDQLGIYLDHAAISPLPSRARRRMVRALEEATTEADAAWRHRLAEVERVRGLAAALLNAQPSELAFVPNTSTGLSLVAEGLSWTSGDNVVGCESEFPANVYPWTGLDHFGVEYRRVGERDDARIDLDDIAAAIDDRTRVVAISWVQFASGFRLDLAAISELCRERGVLCVVDAIQGLGALELDVQKVGVDVVVAGGHKWLLAPEGVGICYIAGRVLERIRPVIRGWLSVKEPFGPATGAPEYREGASRLEVGTANVAGIYGLGASLELLSEAGAARIEGRVLSLAEHAASGLESIDFKVLGGRTRGERSGIVAAEPPGEMEASAIAAGLNERDVHLVERSGRLRVAPHFYTTHEEIERFLEILSEVLSHQ
jgi:selenocysteine lyase/cysteine desulfurase